MHQVYLIQGVPVYTRTLPSGDLAVWHPFNDGIRAIVEPICRGCGYWQADFNNWVIKHSNVPRVRSELATLGILVPRDLP
jgi:hypothetical protein